MGVCGGRWWWVVVLVVGLAPGGRGAGRGERGNTGTGGAGGGSIYNTTPNYKYGPHPITPHLPPLLIATQPPPAYWISRLVCFSASWAGFLVSTSNPLFIIVHSLSSFHPTTHKSLHGHLSHTMPKTRAYTREELRGLRRADLQRLCKVRRPVAVL